MTTNLARPDWTSFTISRVTQSPPPKWNIVLCTPGSSFTSSTVASVTQPLLTFKVVTSDLVMNGMTSWMSSLVTGSKVIFTFFCTISSATFSDRTMPKLSASSLVTSGLPYLDGMFIIGRESP